MKKPLCDRDGCTTTHPLHFDCLLSWRTRQAAKTRVWVAANRERKLEADRTYAKTHKAYANAKSAAWRKANPERLAAQLRDWYARHQPEVKAYREAHLEERRAYNFEAHTKRRAAPSCDHLACLAIGAGQLAWQAHDHVC